MLAQAAPLAPALNLAPLILITLFVLAILAGGFLLRIGLRPRRTGDTRYCAKCRYNLTGSASDRCTECGGDLTQNGSILIGDRIARRGRVGIGSALLLVGLAGGTTAGIAAFKNFDFYTL